MIHHLIQLLSTTIGTSSAEDKQFRISTTGLSAYAFPINGPNVLVSDTTIGLNEWHHVAYVYDGTQEGLYVDGSRVASRAWSNGYNGSHNISNSPNSVNYVGATYRWDSGYISGAFIGLLDTVRISTIARYSGDSFTAPTGDLASDQYTNLLYNFNEPVGSTTITDESGNGRDGTLGVGFTGATSPEFVPEPSSILAMLMGLSGIGGVALRRSRR